MVASAAPPPRLHAILARDTRTGIVFRRGPSKQVCTFLWDRQTDSFSLGQWLNGRIYERRSDLSPDGRHLIYFAADHRIGRDIQTSWTAVSATPFLKALDLYEKGDCWEGGGLFIDNQRYWLNDTYFKETKVKQTDSGLICDLEARPNANFGHECLGVYFPRLLRDGWKWTILDGDGDDTFHAFQKNLPEGWTLTKRCHTGLNPPEGKSVYWDDHQLKNEASGERIDLPDWEWADCDGSGLVWAEKGKIYRGPPQAVSCMDPVAPLFDFNLVQFEPVTAPY